jgi:hypothetical protein
VYGKVRTVPQNCLFLFFQHQVTDNMLQQVNQYNTLCFQGHQGNYNPGSSARKPSNPAKLQATNILARLAASKNYDNITINTGHCEFAICFALSFSKSLRVSHTVGPRVYPGCGLVRRGMQKTLENVSYSSPHGIQRGALPSETAKSLALTTPFSPQDSLVSAIESSVIMQNRLLYKQLYTSHASGPSRACPKGTTQGRVTFARALPLPAPDRSVLRSIAAPQSIAAPIAVHG